MPQYIHSKSSTITYLLSTQNDFRFESECVTKGKTEHTWIIRISGSDWTGSWGLAHGQRWGKIMWLDDSLWICLFMLGHFQATLWTVCKLVKTSSNIRHSSIFQWGEIWKSVLHSSRMVSSGMLHPVALVRADVSEELSASIIRMTRIGELGM
jgi:hypothetical protein